MYSGRMCSREGYVGMARACMLVLQMFESCGGAAVVARARHTQLPCTHALAHPLGTTCRVHSPPRQAPHAATAMPLPRMLTAGANGCNALASRADGLVRACLRLQPASPIASPSARPSRSLSARGCILTTRRWLIRSRTRVSSRPLVTALALHRTLAQRQQAQALWQPRVQAAAPVAVPALLPRQHSVSIRATPSL